MKTEFVPSTQLKIQVWQCTPVTPESGESLGFAGRLCQLARDIIGLDAGAQTYTCTYIHMPPKKERSGGGERIPEQLGVEAHIGNPSTWEAGAS